MKLKMAAQEIVVSLKDCVRAVLDDHVVTRTALKKLKCRVQPEKYYMDFGKGPVFDK